MAIKKKKKSAYCLIIWQQEATDKERAVPSYTHHLEKPLAPGHHVLHKKAFCSSRGELQLHTDFAIVLWSQPREYLCRFANWWNFSLPIDL